MPDQYDISLSKQVENALRAHSELSDATIAVKADQGVITLSGAVKNKEQQTSAVECASGVMNVRSVNDQLRVADEKSKSVIGEYFEDTAITTLVKSKILLEKGLASFEISVKTDDGTVTLTGSTDSVVHSTLVEQLAKESDGVKRVINNLTVE